MRAARRTCGHPARGGGPGGLGGAPGQRRGGKCAVGASGTCFARTGSRPGGWTAARSLAGGYGVVSACDGPAVGTAPVTGEPDGIGLGVAIGSGVGSGPLPGG
jgi:hypothetical protein